jgi:hypothetical protein
MHPYSTALTKSLVISLCFLASRAPCEELKGKVTAANGDSIEVVTDSDYLPNVGDKVEQQRKTWPRRRLAKTGHCTRRIRLLH